MLTLNSNSLAVVRLQMQLRQLDFYSGLIDGFFDETVRQAVKAFQTAYNLQPDGIVGPKTQTVINTICANGYHLLFLHCAATPEGRNNTAADIVAFHTLPVAHGGRGWSRPGYSDIIELSGKLVNIHPYNDDDLIHSWEVTWGVHGSTLLNRNARHVCYIGGMTVDLRNVKDTRTDGQLMTMYDYIWDNLKLNPKLIIAGHNQVQKKGCPSFDVPNYLRSINVPEYNIGNWSDKLKI
jgi:N-acetylmuramoyl-L-alanine amidase